MAAFHFPLLLLTPQFEPPSVESGPFRLSRRAWDVSIFDLATLASKHKLHLPYQLMDVMLARCNTEIRVEATDLQEAFDTFQELRVGMYCHGVSPFLSPYAASHSINDYAGINDRSAGFQEKMHPGLREGITNETATVEAWPFELSLQCIVLQKSIGVTAEQFSDAVTWAASWRRLKGESKLLAPLEDAASAAPTLGSRDQSLLHVWCGLEAIFPRVQTEVSFRVALYLSQLCSQGPARRAYFERVRRAYQLRSDIAHGTKRGIALEQWQDGWELLMDCVASVVRRGGLSNEDALLADLLS